MWKCEMCVARFVCHCRTIDNLPGKANVGKINTDFYNSSSQYPVSRAIIALSGTENFTKNNLKSL